MGTSRTVVHYASGDNRDYEFEWSKAVLEYLEKGYPAEEKNCELEVGSTTYKVLKRDTVTAFYDADGNTLFDVTNDRLKEEYEAKVKWLTAAFDNMQGFRLWEYKWDQKTWKSEHIPKVFIWTAEDKGIMESFFNDNRQHM